MQNYYNKLNLENIYFWKMFNYTLVNQPKFEFKEDTLRNIFKKVEKFVKKTQSGNINIVFLNDEEIRDLNKKYRWIDKSTDVLSFHYHQNFQNFEKYDTVWEVILSEQKILFQSEEYGITIEKEFYNLVIHSVLHILGFDHEKEEDYKEMYALECQIWEDIFKEKKV